METRPLGLLAEALAKAQGEINPPTKNKTVDYKDKSGRQIKYKYADLADVIEAIKIPLSANGISRAHQLGYNPKNMYGLTTSLIHSSGESIATWYPLPDPSKEGARPQEFGAALTYAMRYSISSLVGVASEEDSDAMGAADVKPTEGKRAEKQFDDIDESEDSHITRPAPKPKPKPKEIAPPTQDDIERVALETERQFALKSLRDLATSRLIGFKRLMEIAEEVTGGRAKTTHDLTADECEHVMRYINKDTEIENGESPFASGPIQNGSGGSYETPASN